MAGPSDSAVEARRVLGMRVDATSYEHAAAEIMRWAGQGESRYVCIATVNNVIEARDDPAYQRVMEGSDLTTPDGMPLVWGLGLLGVRGATRVYGPDLTPILCERAAAAGIPVGFYGGTPEVLGDLIRRLGQRYPGLRDRLCVQPAVPSVDPGRGRGGVRAHQPLRCPAPVRRARHSQTGAVDGRQQGEVRAVMVGVGAAFDFIAGRKRQAPTFLQRLGLEWIFRLATEPRRLWRRYLYRNPRFVALFARQLLTERRT